jgi:hypothetical protein
LTNRATSRREYAEETQGDVRQIEQGRAIRGTGVHDLKDSVQIPVEVDDRAGLAVKREGMSPSFHQRLRSAHRALAGTIQMPETRASSYVEVATAPDNRCGSSPVGP